MIFDHTVLSIDKADKENWNNTVYSNERGELKGEIPTNSPASLGKGFTMRIYVDSDHAGDQITRRSRTEFLVFLNNALIYWTSKKQTTIETSLFGSEFMAMKHATEYVRGLRYKLRAMRIPVEECTYIYGDNKSVLVTSAVPHSQLKKKSNSVAFHHVRKGLMNGEQHVSIRMRILRIC